MLLWSSGVGWEAQCTHSTIIFSQFKNLSRRETCELMGTHLSCLLPAPMRTGAGPKLLWGADWRQRSRQMLFTWRTGVHWRYTCGVLRSVPPSVLLNFALFGSRAELRDAVWLKLCWVWWSTYQRLLPHRQDRRVGLQVDPGAASNSPQTLHRNVGCVSEPQADQIEHSVGFPLHREPLSVPQSLPHVPPHRAEHI